MRKLWIALAITCGVLFLGGATFGSWSYYRLNKSKRIWDRPSPSYSRYGRYGRSTYGSRFAALIGMRFIERWKQRTTVGFSVAGAGLALGVLFTVLAARGRRQSTTVNPAMAQHPGAAMSPPQPQHQQHGQQAQAFAQPGAFVQPGTPQGFAPPSAPPAPYGQPNGAPPQGGPR
ncbi:MAG: hypothetical protein KC503_31450 [Myxococcales bacterium]|nr:hypothetical protein [Myxococcales bacterium]